METGEKLHTLVLNYKLDVRERLAELRECKNKCQTEDKELQDRVMLLTRAPIDRQKAHQIAITRRCLHIAQVGRPLEISPTDLKEGGIKSLREHLTQEYPRFSKEEQLLWLNNLLFIMTPSLKNLNQKIANVREFNRLGQQRNFLLGGLSGMGKTHYLHWYRWSHNPTVEVDYNHVPILKIDAPRNDKTPRPLLRRIISGMGMTYNQSDDEDELLELVILFIQQCDVELIMVDEIEHIKRHSIRRKLLEISNLSTGIPIICASCNPLSFCEGDQEIARRWRDSYPLKSYRGKRLYQLLAIIETLLPFSKPSGLGVAEVQKLKGGGKVEFSDGPAKLIESWTDGVLNDIMMLIWDASRCAIEKGEAKLSVSRLIESWKNIQSRPAEKLNDED